MPNQTTNYNLIKPLASENYDVGVQNSNMDAIDAALGTLTAVATQTENGLMSAEDKVKLDGTAAGANKTEIVDNLTSTDASKALSAKQGKALSDAKANKSILANVTLAAASWSNGRYTYSSANITATSIVEILLQEPNVTQEQRSACRAAKISHYSQAAGSITFQARGAVPTVDILVTFIIRGAVNVN
ncbi:MAG: hypothetical protein PHW03_05940 [Eubacteriales bacterium]|nr:hypothetical protein [Eubacteriales bacterium]